MSGKRLVTTLALALSLVACNAVVLPWDQVALRTRVVDNPEGCVLSGREGELVVPDMA